MQQAIWGVILPSRGHLAMSEDIFSYQLGRGGAG